MDPPALLRSLTSGLRRREPHSPLYSNRSAAIGSRRAALWAG
jgi:hypothetical protein